MPHRATPPLKRPWWEKLTGLYLGAAIVVGAAGALYPSRSLATVLGGGALLYSGGMIAFGLVGLRAWWHGHRHAEAVALTCMAALTLLHGALILSVTDGGGVQTAVRLAQAALGTLAWVGIRQAFGVSRATLEESVSTVAHDEQQGDR